MKRFFQFLLDFVLLAGGFGLFFNSVFLGDENSIFISVVMIVTGFLFREIRHEKQLIKKTDDGSGVGLIDKPKESGTMGKELVLAILTFLLLAALGFYIKDKVDQISYEVTTHRLYR